MDSGFSSLRQEENSEVAAIKMSAACRDLKSVFMFLVYDSTIAVIPRKKIDISFTDLLAGAISCSRLTEAKTLEDSINSAWPSAAEISPFLSVRSGFDATLQALNLPEGSEVLVSALTIRDMERIILKHGLVPVPVDLDTRRLEMETASLEAAVSDRTIAILVAHLFGSRMNMDPIVGFARAHSLWLFEDCAQAFTGRDYQGDPRSDVCMFSFGPIKTATALGGGLLFFLDEGLRRKVQTVQNTFPRQSQSKFLKRVIKYAFISCLLRRPVYGVFVAFCKLLGSHHEKILGKSVRGFSGSDFFSQIRQRPSRALLALLARRLELFDPTLIEERRRVGKMVMNRLPDENLIGRNASDHSFWVFPILSEDPDGLVRFLWGRGFDATRGQSSMVVVDSPYGEAGRPPNTTKAYGKLLYLPVSGELGDGDMDRLLEALREFPSQ